MTILGIIFACLLAGFLVWLAQRVPSPWPMVIYVVLIVLAFLALIFVLGLGDVLHQRVGYLVPGLMTG